MDGGDATRRELALEGFASAPGARRLARNAATDWGLSHLADDAALVASELVANALLHAGGVALAVARTEGGLCIEVRDDSAVAPSLVGAEPDGLSIHTTGRGLRLVDDIAARWGVQPDGSGKVVWAELGESSTDERPVEPSALDRASASTGKELRRVLLHDVPARLAVLHDDHLDEVVREIQLVTGGQRELGDEVSLDHDLIDALDAYARSMHAWRDAAATAVAAGRDRFDYEEHVRPEAGSDLQRIVGLLARIDEWAGRGLLLVTVTPPELAAFRKWWADEVGRQIAGRPPQSCPFEVALAPEWRSAPGIEEMRLRDARLRSLIEAAELDVWRADPNGGLISDMPEWRTHTRQGGDDILGDGWLEGVHPDHRSRVMASWRRAVDARSVYQCEYPIVAPDGAVRTIVSRAAPVWEGGELREFVGTTVDVTEQRRAEADMADQTRLVETLHEVGMALVSTLDLQELLARLTEATTQVTGAAFGAFFFNAVTAEEESYVLYTLHGAPRSAFDRFPMPRNTEIFAPTFAGERTVRFDDVMAAPEYGRNEPYFGMPDGHLPVRSYLAVPVISRTGRVHGGLFFGHGEVGRFTERHERMVEALARQAAVAIDNAMLFERQRSVAVALQRRLLPQRKYDIEGVDYAVRYFAGAAGTEVGGDWYDAYPRPDSRSTIAVGDVQGKGVQAAGYMGQVRSAVRAYTLADVAPARAMQLLNRFWIDHASDVLATCLFTVYDPRHRTLEVASAGHLTPFLITAGGVTGTEIDVGPPLGIAATEFTSTVLALAPGDAMAVFTDGLVEDRSRDVDEGLSMLRDALVRATAEPGWTPDIVAETVIDQLLPNGASDDVALVVARFP